MKYRRGAWKVIFGDGMQRWSLGDPGHPRVREAFRVAMQNPLGTCTGDVGILSSIVADMQYLVHGCHTTKEACAKLAAIRAAVRKLGPAEEDGGAK